MSVKLDLPNNPAGTLVRVAKISPVPVMRIWPLVMLLVVSWITVIWSKLNPPVKPIKSSPTKKSAIVFFPPVSETSTKMSLVDPPTSVSVPVEQYRMSSPDPPTRESFPSLPFRVSLPKSPERMIVSYWPVMKSLARPPSQAYRCLRHQKWYRRFDCH